MVPGVTAVSLNVLVDCVTSVKPARDILYVAAPVGGACQSKVMDPTVIFALTTGAVGMGGTAMVFEASAEHCPTELHACT